MFEAAIKLDDKEPQAYANMANFMHNIHRFDDAIKHWQSAADRTDEKKSRMYIMDRLKYSRFGKFSVGRDNAYKEGQVCMIDVLQGMISWFQLRVCFYLFAFFFLKKKI